MKRYRPLKRTVEAPYVPEDFIDILAEVASADRLLPQRAPLRVEVQRHSKDHLRLWIANPGEVLALRFDTLEVWRVNDHTIRYSVTYQGGWLRAIPLGMEVLQAMKWAVAAFAYVLYPPGGRDVATALGLSHENPGSDTGANTLPRLRPIGKRLKEIAAAIPA